MKKSFIYLLSALALSFFFYSCERKDNPIEENEEEYVEVGLIPKGVDISVSPMGTRASSSDIYCVQVWRGNSHSNYATWVTNDLSSEKFKLLKGDEYAFSVMYIPNGQNIIKGVGSVPLDGISELCPNLGDGICYGTKYGVHGALGAARKKEDGESGYIGNGYHFSDVDRYHGVVVVKATASATLDVNLYRQMFGLEVTAKNFSEGKIRISDYFNDDSSYHGNDIVLTPSNPSISKVLEMESMPWGWGNEEEYKNYNGGTCFHIDYIGSDGKAMTIVDMRDYPVKRMTKLIINLDIEAILEDINAGLTPHVVSGEDWSEVKIEY